MDFSWSSQGGFKQGYYFAKVSISNFSPHLRNSAILWTTKTIAELWTKKSCRTAIADLQNLTSAIPQLSEDVFKNQPKISLESSVSMETKNMP
jgi:hypothetical protein